LATFETCGVELVQVVKTPTTPGGMMGHWLRWLIEHEEQQSPKYSLNNLVSHWSDQRWDSQAECFGSFPIDQELEFGRLLNWQIGWLSAF
jgi:hypothetical protein